jgi:hypothetical protein
MSVAFHTDLPRARLDTALAFAPDHMRPILLAVRDHGVAWATIPQHAGRFDVPKTKPFIAIIGDDMHTAMGPAGFHRKSIRRLIARSRVIAIVAAEPLPIAYAETVKAPVAFGSNGLVIETRPERELEWVGMVRAENPNAALILVSVRETAQ